jgi:hypothetical protein
VKVAHVNSIVNGECTATSTLRLGAEADGSIPREGFAFSKLDFLEEKRLVPPEDDEICEKTSSSISCYARTKTRRKKKGVKQETQ